MFVPGAWSQPNSFSSWNHPSMFSSIPLGKAYAWNQQACCCLSYGFLFVIKVYFYIPWGIGLLMFLRNISLNRNAYYFLSIPRASLDPRADARGLGLSVLILGKTYIVRSRFISNRRCDVMTFNCFHAKALRARLRRAFVYSSWLVFIYHNHTVDEMINQKCWVLLPEKVDYSYSVRTL